MIWFLIIPIIVIFILFCFPQKSRSGRGAGWYSDRKTSGGLAFNTETGELEAGAGKLILPF